MSFNWKRNVKNVVWQEWMKLRNVGKYGEDAVSTVKILCTPSITAQGRIQRGLESALKSLPWEVCSNSSIVEARQEPVCLQWKEQRKHRVK